MIAGVGFVCRRYWRFIGRGNLHDERGLVKINLDCCKLLISLGNGVINRVIPTQFKSRWSGPGLKCCGAEYVSACYYYYYYL